MGKVVRMWMGIEVASIHKPFQLYFNIIAIKRRFLTLCRQIVAEQTCVFSPMLPSKLLLWTLKPKKTVEQQKQKSALGVGKIE